MPAAIEDAAAVFVGTVRDVTNSGRWATVEVSEVWKGDVEAVVEVRGGQEDPPGPSNVVSSVDRSFDGGRKYLFVPHAGTGSTFEDTSCSRTTVYREDLERFRPAGASRPDGGEAPTDRDDGWTVPWWAVAAAAGVAAIVAAGLLARRRSAL